MKENFDIDAVIEGVREAVEPYPPAALFQLADEGHDSPFEQLAACIISIRTRDEVTVPTARSLFELATTPQALLRHSVAEIDEAIHAGSFHENKAENIREIARRVVEKHGGKVPCDDEILQGFHGVGPKCAHLVLGIACGEPVISVDVHVHRVTNRWGYVSTSSPEQTMRALREVLPERYRVAINRLLVPFGKHVCTRRKPCCSDCPVLPRCEQVGVEEHR
ncbi:MAG: endonuclease III domain-containing protein [Anaerolineales bacterium]